MRGMSTLQVILLVLSFVLMLVAVGLAVYTLVESELRETALVSQAAAIQPAETPKLEEVLGVDTEEFIEDVINTVVSSEDIFADIETGLFIDKYENRKLTKMQQEIYGSVLYLDGLNEQLRIETDVNASNAIMEMMIDELNFIIDGIDTMRGIL